MASSFEDLLIDILMHGSDRAALVRPATDIYPAGLCVVMMSDVAAGRLGKAIEPVLERLGHTPHEPGQSHGEFGLDTPFAELFAIADRAPRGWLWCSLQYGRCPVLVLLVVGEACAEIAAICSANGAPCSLQRGKPAEGYTVTKTIHRK